MKLNPFNAKVTALPGPFAARVIVADAQHRPATVHHWRGHAREHLSGDVPFEAVSLGRPGEPGTRLATFGDN